LLVFFSERNGTPFIVLHPFEVLYLFFKSWVW